MDLPALPVPTRPAALSDPRAAMPLAPRIRARDLVEGGEPVECRTCGMRAVTVVPSACCASCGSPRLRAAAGSERVVAPAGVLPFAIDRATARGVVVRRLAARWRSPAGPSAAELPEPVGAYVPYWAFEANATASYRGLRADDDASDDRRSSGPRRRRWRAVSGSVRLCLRPRPSCASLLPAAALEPALGPVELAARRPWPPEPLVGTLVERHAIEPDDALRMAHSQLERELREAVRRDIGGAAQRIHDLRIEHDGTALALVLRPVWITVVRHRGRIRRVLVDGRTGAVLGQRSWSSRRRVALALALAALASLAVGLLGS